MNFSRPQIVPTYTDVVYVYRWQITWKSSTLDALERKHQKINTECHDAIQYSYEIESKVNTVTEK